MGNAQFVADAMLGKLAKWLRVLGYDTYYQPGYTPEILASLVGEGRVLLTRHRKRAEQSGHMGVLIHSNHVGEQLSELARALNLKPDPSAWFSRCLVCNVPLSASSEADAREKVPDYIFHQNVNQIRFCPTCGRHYWPGSHRSRMEAQLKRWGFSVYESPARGAATGATPQIKGCPGEDHPEP